ncbi:hypothetical protein M6B38_168480 [Iris pallida]|uniref:Uncharacterized protein n=1 Tax=Iris pallida TaxID=29817 RepID=A0AAX6EWD8_IRIPA|nr:hypothetical protein M6B38_168480 [Iris pallida]
MDHEGDPDLWRNDHGTNPEIARFGHLDSRRNRSVRQGWPTSLRSGVEEMATSSLCVSTARAGGDLARWRSEWMRAELEH